MIHEVMSGFEVEFIINLFICLIIGVIIGAERESRGKVAGISTQCFVIGGAMLFTMISLIIEPASPGRVAAQVVTGIGFVGAGIILKGERGKITNVTTAASIWFSASIGMAIGFGWILIGLIATIYAVLVPRIPKVQTKSRDR